MINNEPSYITHAKALLGEKEVKGKLSNDLILDLYKDAGHPEVKNDEVPWCAAFVGACLRRANKPSTGTLLALDYTKYGKSLGKKPQVGCIGVMKRGNSGWEGHVGFVTKFDATSVWMLGGNQNDSVSVAKFPRNKFVAFVLPKEAVTDKPKKEIISDSRRLSAQRWFERVLVSLGFGGALSWNTLETVKTFASDYAGVLILGLIVTGWLVMRLLGSFSIREYREGRYMPKKQWK